jgi:hypothetical protein
MAGAESKRFELEVTRGDASFRAAGPYDLVMEALAKFESETASAPSKGKTRSATAKQRASEQKPSEPPADLKKDPLSQVIKRDEIKGNAEIATAIVAWAEARENKKSLTKAQIGDYWKSKTTRKVPRNLSRDIATAVKKGYLDADDEGNYSVIGYGRQELGLG